MLRHAEPTTAQIRVLTAGTQPLIQESVARAIRQRPAFRLVGEVLDGGDALGEIMRLVPDVAVLQMQPPALDARAVLRALRRRGIATHVLILGDVDHPGDAYDALAEGAAGWLTPAATREELYDAVLLAGRGDVYLPREFHGDLVNEIRLRSRGDRTLLSPRELQILELIANGWSGPRIARELQIGVGTVKTHTAHVLDKLGVDDRAAAVAEGMRRGLLD
jgi:two-component system, NarL family, nitrate/nitrite response regulator NarL